MSSQRSVVPDSSVNAAPLIPDAAHLHVRRVGIGHCVRTRVEIRPTPRQSHGKQIIQPYTKQRFIGYFIDYRDEGRSGTLLLIGGGASLTILFLIQRADTAAREHLEQDRMLRTNARLFKESWACQLSKGSLASLPRQYSALWSVPRTGVPDNHVVIGHVVQDSAGAIIGRNPHTTGSHEADMVSA